ncbi:unnamed protein product [Leptosia nina]|uniref:Uncharacterized protein n=1 Tax=Leptosia nina TaxID=320188 RepID=A0AAV1JIG8_9NEOP
MGINGGHISMRARRSGHIGRRRYEVDCVVVCCCGNAGLCYGTRVHRLYWQIRRTGGPSTLTRQCGRPRSYPQSSKPPHMILHLPRFPPTNRNCIGSKEYVRFPQLPEINDQFDTQKPETVTHINKSKLSYISEEYDITEKNRSENATKPKHKVTYLIYRILTAPLAKLMSEPRVMIVLKNIGTCIVNGVMEIISYYFPAPFMPLIATAAGILMPFEPVVTLRRRMPVTSYRRAFKTAINSFLNTFDAYKVDNLDDDPYMTRRFNRRFLNSDEKRKY